MNERIKLIRLELGLSQEKFGKPIFLKKSGLSLIENGKNAVTEQVVRAICREYNVNETWLRTGEGKMFLENNRDELLAEFTMNMLTHENEEYVNRFVSALSKLDVSQWELIANMAEALINKKE